MNRNVALDFLRITLAFMVAARHSGFLKDVSEAWFYLTINGPLRVAVPIFLLLNGFFFYAAVSEGRHRRWFKRILGLYVLWMAVYLYAWLDPQHPTWGYVGKLALTVLVGYYHLWYLPGLILAALLVYAMRNVSLRVSVAAICVTFAIGIAIQYLGRYHLVGDGRMAALFVYYPSHRNFLFLCFPFVYAGYLINRHGLHLRVSSRRAVVLVVAGFLLQSLEAYANYRLPGRERGFDNFAALMLVCPALFVLFLKMDVRGATKELAQYANGVYFVHIAFLLLLQATTGLGGTAMTLLVASASMLASYLLIEANKRLGVVL